MLKNKTDFYGGCVLRNGVEFIVVNSPSENGYSISVFDFNGNCVEPNGSRSDAEALKYEVIFTPKEGLVNKARSHTHIETMIIFEAGKIVGSQ